MKEISSNQTEGLEDELLPEYDIDYSKVKPNRFADRMDVQVLRVVVLDDDVVESLDEKALFV